MGLLLRSTACSMPVRIKITGDVAVSMEIRMEASFADSHWLVCGLANQTQTVARHRPGRRERKLV
jgi:hypothetical protein